MVIDKTTGRGCALSITSKAIAKELIADGIVGKTIYRKQRIHSKSNYDLFQVVRLEHEEGVYVRLQRGGESAEESLWAPSFIDAGIWTQAVSRFPTLERLDKCVEKYLLPEMDEYLRAISDAELIAMTRDFLIEHGVIKKPICQRGGRTYYFNEDEIYSVDKKSELFPNEGRIKYDIFKTIGETCFNMNVWSKATAQFEVGMTLSKCIETFLKTELVYKAPQKRSSIDQLVQYIAPPKYECSPENSDKATFDRIRITVGLPRYQFESWEALKGEVEKHQHEIYQRVIQQLEKDRQLKRYGVPINFLELSSVMLLHDFSIEFIFEPKVTSSTSPQKMENKNNI